MQFSRDAQMDNKHMKIVKPSPAIREMKIKSAVMSPTLPHSKWLTSRKQEQWVQEGKGNFTPLMRTEISAAAVEISTEILPETKTRTGR